MISRDFKWVAVIVASATATVCLAPPADAQEGARITVERRSILTYPFDEPDPVPLIGDDPRLYPYHRFGGYAHAPEEQMWTVVHLENDWIELWVLPEVGGKVWGARVKESGHEFIYRNEVMKFRNIALRGPWTSGGIEFNFGVIGHTPATATPVDWTTRENDDGSVSVFVGTMDLPSRTKWRVEVRLPPDRAFFETRALWHNPTALEQPYYNWMTGAAFAQPDLVMTIPGNAYLEHPGGERAWPIDAGGRDLAAYAENDFGSNKSFHVVGEYEDFFGGYYRADDYGFGHWSPYEEMPGQKLWLWALSRQGGIWEDLLTDTDGQYIEFQAGRLLVQYTPNGEVNPISQVGFDPGALDQWTETWFPVEGLGGLSEASREGALFVEEASGELVVRAHAFSSIVDTVVVSVDGAVVARQPTRFEPLEVVEVTAEIPTGGDAVVDVEVPGLGLAWSSDPEARALARPFRTDPDAWASIPAQRRTVEEARELLQGRRFGEARALFSRALDAEPWRREALLGMADLELRRGRFEEGLAFANRVLQLDAYDAEGNFAAGRLYRALGRDLDAREAFGWSARSMAFRSVSYAQLADLALRSGSADEAGMFARRALDYDRHSLAAYEVLAIAARTTGDRPAWNDALDRIEQIDPLSHFVAFERLLAARDVGSGDEAGEALRLRLRSEFPAQEVLELGVTYHARGQTRAAASAFDFAVSSWNDPMARAWLAAATGGAAHLDADMDVRFAAPFRTESIDVLEAAVSASPRWQWRYLLALATWAHDRTGEAAGHFADLAELPDEAAAFAARAAFAASTGQEGRNGFDPDADFRRARVLAPDLRPFALAHLDYLIDAGRWAEADAVASEARARFPGGFELEILHATAWNASGRYEESVALLESIEVLPSEHSSSSRRLFSEAHSWLGVRAYEERRFDDASAHFEAARTWPESLGLGRPYEPEERVPLFLSGLTAAQVGDEGARRTAFQEVVEHTASVADASQPIDPFDLVGVLAADALGQGAELADFGAAGSGNGLEGVAAAVRAAVRSGGSVTRALLDAAREAPGAFVDADGALILRAIELAGQRAAEAGR